MKTMSDSIYVVEWIRIEADEIMGVFQDKAKAEAIVKTIDPEGVNLVITEHPLNTLSQTEFQYTITVEFFGEGWREISVTFSKYLDVFTKEGGTVREWRNVYRQSTYEVNVRSSSYNDAMEQCRQLIMEHIRKDIQE